MKSLVTIVIALFSLLISVSSQSALLTGPWQLTKVTVGDKVHANLKAVFIFDVDGVLKSARSTKHDIMEVGTWQYNASNKQMVMKSTIDRDFRGKALITSLSNTDLVYEKDGATLFFMRLPEMNAEPIRSAEAQNLKTLDFVIDDFFDENDEYKYYDHEEKLPWQNPQAMVSKLVGVKHLIYQYSIRSAGEEVAEEKTLKAKVLANADEQTLSIDFIFYGYDRYNLPDDVAMMPNADYTTLLYPEKENTFRVVGEEQVSVKAGQFECTVIEVAGEFDECRKMWMINDKPGVYAKIVVAKGGDFGYYAEFELQEIE